MPLGTEIGLGPGDIVLDGYPAPHGKGHSSRLHFSVHVYCGQTAECIRILFGTEVGLGSGVIVLHGDPRKGAQQPPTFGPCLLRPNGRPSQQQCWALVTYWITQWTVSKQCRKEEQWPQPGLVLSLSTTATGLLTEGTLLPFRRLSDVETHSNKLAHANHSKLAVCPSRVKIVALSCDRDFNNVPRSVAHRRTFSQDLIATVVWVGFCSQFEISLHDVGLSLYSCQAKSIRNNCDILVAVEHCTYSNIYMLRFSYWVLTKWIYLRSAWWRRRRLVEHSLRVNLHSAYCNPSLARRYMTRVKEGSQFYLPPTFHPRVECAILAFTSQPQGIAAVWLVPKYCLVTAADVCKVVHNPWSCDHRSNNLITLPPRHMSSAVGLSSGCLV